MVVHMVTSKLRKQKSDEQKERSALPSKVVLSTRSASGKKGNSQQSQDREDSSSSGLE